MGKCACMRARECVSGCVCVFLSVKCVVCECVCVCGKVGYFEYVFVCVCVRRMSPLIGVSSVCHGVHLLFPTSHTLQ